MTLTMTSSAVETEVDEKKADHEHAHHIVLANWILTWEWEFPEKYLEEAGGVEALAKNQAFILVLDAKAKLIATLDKESHRVDLNTTMPQMTRLKELFGNYNATSLTDVVIDVILSAGNNAREMMKEGE